MVNLYHIGQFIKACLNVGTEQHKAMLLAVSLKGEIKCFNCRSAGHIWKECGSKNKPLPGKECPGCHKGKHWAKQCRSTHDMDGKLLPSLQRNKRYSSAPSPNRSPHSSKQLFWAQENVGSPISALPLGRVQGWTWSPLWNSS